MKKLRKIIFALSFSFVIGLASICSIFAAATETYKDYSAVAGGTITAYATYYQSGDRRWSITWAHTLTSYNNVKASGVTTYREWKEEHEYLVGGQLYKVDYSYITTKLGSHLFTFTR